MTGKYGAVETVPAEDFKARVLNCHLGGKVYVIEGSLIVTGDDLDAVPPVDVAPDKIVSAPSGENGSGTVVIKSGDLYIYNDLEYDDSAMGPLDRLSRLASLGWIVLDENDPEKPGYNQRGNIFVGKDVTHLVGSFLSTGQSGFFSVAPPATDSPKPLLVEGLVVARQFHLSRSYKSLEQGSESVAYDGRAVANPPPGFEDVTKTMPAFGDLPAP